MFPSLSGAALSLVCADLWHNGDARHGDTGSGVTVAGHWHNPWDITLHNPNIFQSEHNTPTLCDAGRYHVLFVRYISRARSVIDWSGLCNQLYEHGNMYTRISTYWPFEYQIMRNCENFVRPLSCQIRKVSHFCLSINQMCVILCWVLILACHPPLTSDQSRTKHKSPAFCSLFVCLAGDGIIQSQVILICHRHITVWKWNQSHSSHQQECSSGSWERPKLKFTVE